MIKDVLMSIDFEEKLESFSNDDKKIVEQKVKYLVSDRRHPSLNVHPVKRAKASVKIFECYITGTVSISGARLLFAEENQSLLLYDIGGHSIIDKVHHRRFDNVHFTRWEAIVNEAKAESIERIQPKVYGQQWALRKANENKNEDDFNPFSYFLPSRLRILGVPQELVQSIKEATNLTEVISVPGLPEAVSERLLDLATSPKLVDVLSNSERLLFRTTLDRLYDYCEGKIKKLMLNLEPEQRQYVDMKRVPLLLLKGVAGSGKTTIGIYRAIELALQGRHVLLVTFNATLSKVTKALVEELMGPLPENLEIHTLHSVMCHLLGSRLRIPQEHETYVDDFIRDALTQVRSYDSSAILKREQAFFAEEIKRVIKGVGITCLDEYKEVKRYGRKSALGPRQRELVWRVYEVYQQKLVAAKRHDWSDVALLTLQMLEHQMITTVYDDIIVDETQDLVPTDIKVIQRLVAPRVNATEFGSVLLLGDAAQTLYSRGFSWEQAGIQVRGRTAIIRRTHRSTRQIAEAAAHLLKQNAIMRSSNEYIDPEWTSRQGPLPTVIKTRDTRNWQQNRLNQIEVVRERILDLVSKQVYRLADFAILCKSNGLCRTCKRELEEVGLRVALSKDSDFNVLEEQIKVLTIHSAKGLEFPVVFLLGLIEGEFPALYRMNDMDDEEKQLEIEKERTLCYVGITRAAHELYLVTVQGCESRFIHELADKVLVK